MVLFLSWKRIVGSSVASEKVSLGEEEGSESGGGEEKRGFRMGEKGGGGGLSMSERGQG
jgi:hypothetical protein